MSLVLEVTDGDLKGQRFPLRNGMAIGRRNADVTIKDPRVSVRHAVVEVRPEGGYQLIDQGSSNGIKTPEGRVRQLLLTDGVTFALGRTAFRVIELATDSTEPEIVIEESTPAPENWWNLVQKVAERGAQGRVVRSPIFPFEPILRLRFIQGIQAGTEWTLGYGPREAGTDSSDLLIEEVGAPPVCFRIVPHHRGALLKNEAGPALHLNGHPVESELLHDGDVIEIKNTRIEIEFGSDGE